jgi:protein-S-isoprenylcysteine O-methyltransferase Ste14
MNRQALLLVFFAVFSAGLLAVSWRSLRVPGSHGFHRFFAWEAILALLLVNSHAWFTDPGSPLQIVSWVLLCLSLLVLGPGVHRLRTAGKRESPQEAVAREEGAALFRFERTTELVTSGIYRWIRHPLYASLLYLAWGAFLKEVTWISSFLTAMATVFLLATARADEKECQRTFGSAYGAYMKETKMFVPFLW